MLDPYIRSTIDRVFCAIGKAIAPLPITANAITFCAALLIPFIVYNIAIGAFWPALALIILNRSLDALDGTIARIKGVTDFGGYADIVADFIFYASIPVAFTIYDSNNGLASSLVLFSYIGTSSSFLTYAIIAAKRDMHTEKRGKKSFFHLGGFIEGTESILYCLIVCIWPADFALITYIFAGLCGLSTIGRVIMAHQDFS